MRRRHAGRHRLRAPAEPAERVQAGRAGPVRGDRHHPGRGGRGRPGLRPTRQAHRLVHGQRAGRAPSAGGLGSHRGRQSRVPAGRRLAGAVAHRGTSRDPPAPRLGHGRHRGGRRGGPRGNRAERRAARGGRGHRQGPGLRPARQRARCGPAAHLHGGRPGGAELRYPGAAVGRPADAERGQALSRRGRTLRQRQHGTEDPGDGQLPGAGRPRGPHHQPGLHRAGAGRHRLAPGSSGIRRPAIRSPRTGWLADRRARPGGHSRGPATVPARPGPAAARWSPAGAAGRPGRRG